MGLNLVARLGLDGKAFQTGLARANRQTGQFAGGIKRQFAGMFGVAAIGVAIKKATDYADEINNLSRRLGVSTKALQEFNYAANLSGSDLKTVSTSLQRVQEAQERLKNGNKLAEESFERLGFSAAAALSANPAEVFRQAGEKFANTALTPEMFGDIRTLFGAEAGPRNIRIFTEDLAAMSAQAVESGAVMSDQQIQTAADLKDTMSVLRMQFLGPFGQALAGLGKIALEGTAHFKAFLVAVQAGLLNFKGGQDAPPGLTMTERFSFNLRRHVQDETGVELPGQESDAFIRAKIKAREDFKKNRKTPSEAFADAYHEILSEELVKIGNQFDQSAALRNLLTSTAQMGADSAGKTGTKIKTDELARMGLFIGGRRNPLINAAEKQVEEIRGVKQEVETLNKQIKKKL